MWSARRRGCVTLAALAVCGGCGGDEPSRDTPPARAGTGPTVIRGTPVIAVAPTEQPHRMRLLFGHSGDDRFSHVELRETNRTVELAVRLRGPRGLRSLDRTLECLIVTLASPLGDREVRDLRDDERVPFGHESSPPPADFITRARCAETRAVRTPTRVENGR